MTLHSRKAAALALILSSSVGCSGNRSSRAARTASLATPDTMMYRLALRHNAVDPGAAFRCYGGCQAELNPKAYLSCLTECPGFEVAEGDACTKNDVPPVAACFTARLVERKPEVTAGQIAGQIVVMTIGGLLYGISLNAFCNAAGGRGIQGGSCNLGSWPY